MIVLENNQPDGLAKPGSDGTRRSGHHALLWVITPILWGYVLGHSGLFVAPVLLLAISLVFLALAFTLSSGARSFVSLHWGAAYLLGCLCLSWAWWITREPIPPNDPTPPAREVTLTLEIDRLFGRPRANGQISGTATIREAPKLLPELLGQHCYYQLWPEAFRESIAPGAILEARARLKPLLIDEHSNDFLRYLYRSGTYYTFELGQFTRLTSPAPAPEQWARQANAKIRNILSMGSTSETEDQLAGVSQAMLLGWKDALQPDQKERYIESGTMHLFAVSGLHIGVIAGALALLLNALRVPLRPGAFIGLGLLLAYVWVVGHPPSAIRAYLMLFCYWLAVAFTRKPSAFSALLASAILLLIYNPQELLRPGFQLSYAVVGGILLYGVPLSQWLVERLPLFRWLPEISWSWRQHLLNKIWRGTLLSFGISLAATVFSSPLVLLHFGVFTPGAILLNILMMPLATIAIISAAVAALIGLAGLTSLAGWVNHLTWALIWLLDQIVQLAVLIPGIFLTMQWRWEAAAPISICLLFLSYLAVLHLPRFRPVYFMIPPALLVAMLASAAKLTF